MNWIYKFFLTFNATSWMLIVYAVKTHWTILNLPFYVCHIILILLLISLSWFTLPLSKVFGREKIDGCKECVLADNEFLPVYLGYFFVSLSVAEWYTMLIVYIIVFIFTFLSQTQYFNPAYLLFHYHYYHILTSKGTRVLVIKKGKAIRNNDNIIFENLRRINDTTFIERR